MQSVHSSHPIEILHHWRDGGASVSTSKTHLDSSPCCASPQYVDREFGTGALKITPGHDPNDYAIGQKVGLPIINIMNKDGSLNANAGAYAGMDRFAVREQLWADMERQGLALKAEPYTLRVPRSQRGGEVGAGKQGTRSMMAAREHQHDRG